MTPECPEIRAPILGSAAWLFQDSADLFLETDASGRIVRVNAAWKVRLGWTTDELVDRLLAELLHPQDVADFTAGREETVRIQAKSGGWQGFSGLSRTDDDGNQTTVLRPTSPPSDADDDHGRFIATQRMLAQAGMWSFTLDVTEGLLYATDVNSPFFAGGRVTSHQVAALIHPEDRGEAEAAFHRVMAEGVTTSQYRMQNLAGEWRRMQVRLRRETGRNGQPVVHGLAQDVTEQLGASGRAIETADRLRMALDSARAGVCEVDLQAMTVWCSDQLVQILGQRLQWPAADQVPFPMCLPEDRAWLLDPVWVGRRHEPLELCIRLPDGGTRWVEWHGERQVDAAGQLSKITSLVRDIDVRKRQELALIDARREAQANAERLNLAMDAAKGGVFEVHFKQEAFWCSPEFVQIVGQSLDFEDAAGIWSITHPDDVEQVAAAVAASQAGNQDATAEWRVRLPSGHYRWIEARGRVQLDENGERVKLVGMVLDVDARKRQELALIEAERSAQDAAEAKSQFLANMSHEIRTPMNGVLGVLHLLGKESLRDEARQLLVEAESCGKMLSQLLNDVIDLSKIEAGKLELAPETLEPGRVLNGVADLLRPQAEAKGLKLITRTPDEAMWVSTDPVRLRQALFNLLGNAVKFTTEGQVEARLSSTVLPDGRRRLRFEIEDTGIGIPASAQASLFQRFTQADGSDGRRFGGSGLGLAITRSLAEVMDGLVGFESREGEGSTFWLEISAPPAAEAPSDHAVVDPSEILAGLTLLVVEDNPTNRLVASKILESLGATVEIAEDGLEGLNAVQTRAYDLVLMDVQMPRMDGVEATRRIRALGNATARVPIIALTANVMAHQRAVYLAAGMNGVAAKPISPTELVAEIARVFDAARRDTKVA
jgi:PAS domain S-box-containing protein